MTRRYTRRGFVGLASSAAAAALLAACGRGGEAGSATPAVEGVPALRLRGHERPGDDARDGTLRLGALAEPTGFDPVTRYLAYSRLVAVDPRTALVYGDLARDVEVVEPLAVRFRLRDAHFHPDADGLAQAVTAGHVARDFERRAAEGSTLFTDIVASVEAPDDSTVVLHLRGPFGLLFESLAALEASVRSDVPYEGFGRPLGSGPFVPVAEQDRDLLLAAAPVYHHDRLPRLDGIAVRRFPDERSWVAGFVAGAVDDWAGDAGALAFDDLDARAVVRSQRPEHRMRALGLSLLPARGGVEVRHVAAFQDRRVRRAVSHALDRDALLGLDGSVLAGPVGPAHAADALPEADLRDHPLYRRDPAEARGLLEAAEQVGLGFELRFPDSAPLRAIAQQAGEQLVEAGFAPVLSPVRPDEWQKVFTTGNFDTALFEVSRLETPDVGLRLHMSGGLDGRYSPWGYSNPIYDHAVRRALSAINPAERAALAREAQILLLEDVPAMFPLGAPVEHALLARPIDGFEHDAYEFNLAWLASTWALPGGGGEG